ncbi:hypothetical protein J5Y04_28615 [Kitasatospora sp. RG8]|uniref:hypothetical protein n=1 Tax=Kitasatospora sp. RG8 TaxID=2820815 RepID=UPI001AE0C531|nr:hypothetical protein [Kitasatospora sp. RG8]MBP0453478.1 hypothetical protein [Kitasatospora sp. RG8]
MLVVAHELDLTDTFFTSGAVRLLGADIAGQLSLRGAKLNGANRDGEALVADGMKVGNHAFLDEGFEAGGVVRLNGANIGGQLYLSGAKLNGTDSSGNALFANGVKVGEDAFLGDGFEARGAVRLFGADIAGQLYLSGAMLNGTDGSGNALVADFVKVGTVVLEYPFEASGTVRLLGAQIAGQLTLKGAKLNGTDEMGNAFAADQMKAGDTVFLDEGFEAVGVVRLIGANIGGGLHLTGARLNGTVDSLVADSVKIGGHAFLDEGFTAEGKIDLHDAQIKGSLSFADAQLSGTPALLATGMSVLGELHWRPRQPVDGLVNLERALVRRLVDDWSRPAAYWPPKGNIRLVGLTYDGFGGDAPATWKQRLDWIRCSHIAPSGGSPARFSSQPYEQLARVYSQAGQDTEAREVAIARREDLRKYGHLSRPRWFGNWLLGKTIAHGYKPLRAVVMLLAVYLITLTALLFAQHHGAIAPAKDTQKLNPSPAALGYDCKAYPCFYPAGYAVDVVVPLINVHQAENWRPNGWGWAAGIWGATGAGWALSTLAVVGYTGLVRKVEK